MSSKCFCRLKNFSLLQRHSSSAAKESNLWYPDYLHLAKTEYPEHNDVNIQIRGFDFPVLENYHSKIVWIAKQCKLKVTENWVQAFQKVRVVRYKPRTEILDAEYILNIYERNTQVRGVYSHEMPVLIYLIMTICPPGVKVSVHNHTEEHFENRFVPNYKVLELQQRRREIGKK